MKRRGRALMKRYGHAEGGGFGSWAEVLEAARRGETLFYKAPMDVHARRFIPSENDPRGRVPYTYVVRARTIRMWPPGSVGRGRFRTSDPFNADAGHLDRFSRSA